jgi:hypothetical protein
VFDRFLFPLALASHWLDEFANCTTTADKMTNAVPPNLSAELAARHSTFIILHLLLEIVANNKPLTVTSQPNLELNARNSEDF